MSHIRDWTAMTWVFVVTLPLAGILAGLVAALAGFVEAARITDSITGLCLVALASACLAGLTATWAILRGLRGTFLPRAGLILASGFGALVATLAAGPLGPFATLPHGIAEDLPVPASVRYWDLSTGSRIAWLKAPGEGTVRPTPIVLLHGGPGVGEVACFRGVSEFSKAGFDVYYYDQVGAGLSARLLNIGEYTVERHVRDLEEIRKQIGAERMTLIGASWGGTLAAQYMAQYPDRVAKAVLVSPGAIEPAEWVGKESGGILSRLPAERRKHLQTLLSGGRMGIALRLAEINPVAAHRFLPDAEIDSFIRWWLRDAFVGALCSGGSAKDSSKPSCISAGQWSNIMTVIDSQTHRSGTRTRLGRNLTPVLVLTGECNYVPWPVTHEYASALPNAKIVVVPGAGHVIVADRPELYYSLVRSYLLNQPLALPFYAGTESIVERQ